MIDLYTWATPNGRKISIMLEECGLPYRVHPVDITKGEQFAPEFVRINPNSKIPAIVDDEGPDGAPLTLFESGAILIYLAEKTGRFLPAELRGRTAVLEWLFWQVGGLGPMSGQNTHFRAYAPERIPYAISRYENEVNRLYGVLDRRLEGRDFLAGEYSIADMACYPWVVPHERQGQRIEEFPRLKAWLERIAARPAVVRAYAIGRRYQAAPPPMDEERRRVLFGQTAASVAAGRHGPRQG